MPKKEETFQPDPNREVLPAISETNNRFNRDDPWVLVMDFRIPTPDQDSGSVRMLSILCLLQEMRFRVTFIADSEDHLPDYKKELEKRGIYVFQGSGAACKHLASEGEKYHFTLLSRPAIAYKYLPYVRAYSIYSKVIYDTVDLHWVRFEREMNVSGDPALADVVAHYRRMELFNATSADLVLAITDEEKNHLLVERPNLKISVLPNIHEVFPPKASFNKRSGLLFIGGFWHKPNEDAVIYFVNDVLPRITDKIPDLVFYIIGSNMPKSIKSLQSAKVKPLGFVQDVAKNFEESRIFIAPLRFGAGMKGKVGQSMSYGLPVVTTRIGAEGMGLEHEKHLLIAEDPKNFADQITRLYGDEVLWRRLSINGLTHIRENYSPTTTRHRMNAIFTQTIHNERLGELDVPDNGKPTIGHSIFGSVQPTPSVLEK